MSHGDSLCPLPYYHPQQSAHLYTLDRIYSQKDTETEWEVRIGTEFIPEFRALPDEAQDEAGAIIKLLQQLGPQLGRPRVDTLNGSQYANMKEMRFDAAGGVWRIAFAFDPKRRAMLLVAGDKSGGSEKRFYQELIRKADQRFEAHLNRIKNEGK